MVDLVNFKFSKDHEWVRVEGSKAYIGITDHAQHALGDIVFIDLPQLDVQMEAGDVLGVIESVKAASDIYSPISGIVAEVNEALSDTPEKINEAPYESWIAVVEYTDEKQLDGLMSLEAYEIFCSEEA